MDVTNIIDAKRDELIRLKPDSDIDSVLRHLKTAEKHFSTGQETSDGDYFTDVIYRTNQVFEGILKEAYEVIASKSAIKLTPAKIENYLIKANAFKPRVLDLFTSYRQDWRNPSTHDHRLDFDEQEAFMAILTVSSFCYVSINQMNYILAEKSVSLKPSKTEIMNAFDDFAREMIDGIQKALLSLQPVSGKYPEIITETTALGIVSGVVRSLYPDNAVTEGQVLKLDGRIFRPDLLIDSSDNNINRKMVIELKTIPPSLPIEAPIRMAMEQIKEILERRLALIGVVIALPRSDIKNTQLEYEISKNAYGSIVVIKPKWKK